jgi:hypothetical protein
MRYIKIFLLLIAGVALSSCYDFLEEVPTGSLTDKARLTSADAGKAFATGAYRALRGWTAGTSEWGGNQAGAREYATGKAYSQYMGARLWKFEQDDQSGEEDYFTGPWNNWYQGVRDCNLSIEMIPTIDGLSSDDKSKYLGEVRTLRAFYYFCLVRQYGDVVYNTETLKDASLAQRPRSSLKKIYDEIIVPDLEFAVKESKLPDGRSNDGRVTKDVARAVLADVYLTMAGYPYQEVNTDTTKAWCEDGLWSMTEYPVNTQSAKTLLQNAREQLNALYGKYPIGEFSDLNNPNMNNKGGAIFQIQYMSGVSDFPVAYWLPLNLYVSVFTNDYGTNIPSVEYHASFNSADKRIQDRVYFYYRDTKSKKYDPNESPVPLPVPFLYKFYDYEAVKNTGHSGLNWNLYRYADILLMLTEVNWCLRQLGISVSDDDIVKGINEVRRRAELSEFAASDLTLKDIMSERAYELIFENKMLWDMRRTRKALVDGEGEFKDLENLVGHQPTHFDHKFTPKHLLSPISATEIKNNHQCSQNFGWQPVQQVAK